MTIGIPFARSQESRVTPGARERTADARKMKKNSIGIGYHNISQLWTLIDPDKCLLQIGNARHTPLHAHDRTGAWTGLVVDEWPKSLHGMLESWPMTINDQRLPNHVALGS